MDTQPKFFSLEEANRTLPLVERIVGDIVDVYPSFRDDLQRFHELASDETTADASVSDRLESLRQRIDRTSERINDFIRELHEIGCLFKGFEDGLVDFYGVYRDRPIFLCWRHGEDRIRYWHEVEAGFGGRQPITPEMERELSEPHTAEMDALS